jgi:hypothetical protein
MLVELGLVEQRPEGGAARRPLALHHGDQHGYMALEAVPPPVAELRGDHGGLVDGLQRMAMVPPVVVHLVDGAAHRGPGRFAGLGQQLGGASHGLVGALVQPGDRTRDARTALRGDREPRSIFGVVGIPQRAAYASSKHGVLGSAMWSYGLASDAAACITGTSIDVHGGWIAHGGW